MVSETSISYHFVLAVVNSLLRFIFDGIAVKEASSSEAWEIFTVRVTSEDEATVSDKLKWLVWVAVDDALLNILYVLTILFGSLDVRVFDYCEAEGRTWCIGDK